MAEIQDRLGLTLVIAPIISLVRNGAESTASFVPEGGSVFLDVDTSHPERQHILKRIEDKDPTLHFVHVTPAMLVMSYELRGALSSARIRCVVLDEYHVISEWEDFYGSMSDICEVVLRLPTRPPFVLLSATASKEITDQVLRRLGGIPDVTRIEAPLVRPHVELGLTLVSCSKNAPFCDTIARWIQANSPCESDLGIVFTPDPVRCQNLANGLSRRGISCVFYHGKLPAKDDRGRQLRLWGTGGFQVVNYK